MNTPKNIIQSDLTKSEVTLDGFMTIGKSEDMIHGDFQCCEDVHLEPFVGNFKVQGMRDGNVYFTQRPKRVRNTPIFREDNSSLSKGKNRRYYFVFSMEEERIADLPEELVRQASVIAGKVLREVLMVKGSLTKVKATKVERRVIG
jgi:hypothetical protein